MSTRLAIDDYKSACRFLLELKSSGVSLGLDRMQQLVAALDHPETQFATVHVAGTNGKGSVAAMLEAILREAGWRTGLYTSPHLVRLGERVQVDRQSLSEAEMVNYVREIRERGSALFDANHPEVRPSYFEFMTALALLHFQRRRCEIAVIEVGLGGRLDATNVILPEVSVITSIGFDHSELLGNTLGTIAAEKAGIIKSATPVVIGRMPAEAENVIRAIAKQRNAPVHAIADQPEARLSPSGVGETNLEGVYQRENAATAALAARVLSSRWRVTDDIVSRALHKIDWPGRWQRMQVGDKTLVLDAAHNEEGARSLEINLEELLRVSGRMPVIVAGVLGVSRARPLIEVVCRHSRDIVFVRPQQSRACTFEELEALVPASCSARISRGSVEQLFPSAFQCTAGEPGDIVVVTGSIYLVGEVLARIDPSRGPFEGHLQDF